jgi:hypothetical protein
MATDPYSSMAEGINSGIAMTSNLVTAQAKKAEMTRETQKQEFGKMTASLKTYAEVLKSDAPASLRQAAANGILGMYKKFGKDMGIDPAQLPNEIKFDEEFAKGFANRILSMGKLLEKEIIGKWDYRAGMYELAQDYKNMTGKENPDIMKMASDIAGERKARFGATQGTDKTMFQETTPGSGNFSPMTDTNGNPISGPAAQRIEVVKPPSESERQRIAEMRTDIGLYNDLIKTVSGDEASGLPGHPDWVGLGRDGWSKVAGKFDLMPQAQQEFYSAVRLNKLRDTKFFLGTAQSKQEAKNAISAIPDISMGTKQFLASVETTKANKAKLLNQTLDVLEKSGIKVPEDATPSTVVNIYQNAKASGKLTGGSSKRSTAGSRQDLLLLLQEAEKETGE